MVSQIDEVDEIAEPGLLWKNHDQLAKPTQVGLPTPFHDVKLRKTATIIGTMMNTTYSNPIGMTPTRSAIPLPLPLGNAGPPSRCRRSGTAVVAFLTEACAVTMPTQPPWSWPLRTEPGSPSGRRSSAGWTASAYPRTEPASGPRST